ncbi:hypothetical protein [Mucilaginibacter sp. SG564]|uniref:hypothetical protein n=1 Tax=Mucilaginibacter sp. SG564 TaxID=2587022 RepID=UPI0015558FB1|nr:hypothetical protein [Mucilaginibacter sp. SG564]NOW98947.1 hypothetical protein [Mucilaginibacter sp. SG564]
MKKWLCCALLVWPLALFGGQRDTCYTGIYLKNMYDLRPEEYACTTDFWMWFDYRRKGFDPLNNVELINAKQVSFADPYYARADGRLLLASESCRAILIHDWKLKNYPFDRQALQIQLEAGLDTSRMILKGQAEGLKLYSGLGLPGWHIIGYGAKESLVHYDSDFGERRLKGHSAFSRITYEVRIQRNSWGLFFKLFIGLYISFAVAVLVFFVPPARDQRFGLSIGGLFAAVGNKYVMDSNIPATTAFSFVDQIHDLTFLFILATLVLSVVSLRMAENGKLERALKFDRRAAWVVLGLYMEMNLALIALATSG